MNCKKCGKPIDDGENYCLTCRSEENEIHIIEEETDSSFGLKKSLISLIFAVLAGFILVFVTIFIGIILANLMNKSSSSSYPFNNSTTAIEYPVAVATEIVNNSGTTILLNILCALFSLLAMAFAMIALILGIRNVVLCAKRFGNPEKPIAPFILACAATLFGTIDVFWATATFFLALVSMISRFLPI